MQQTARFKKIKQKEDCSIKSQYLVSVRLARVQRQAAKVDLLHLK